ncbi:MAG: hypothetical protein JEY94_13610 [Melioribacteraceae bacterium]|nr:hypothetical protein [Melioribacteraceae bacterium]
MLKLIAQNIFISLHLIGLFSCSTTQLVEIDDSNFSPLAKDFYEQS